MGCDIHSFAEIKKDGKWIEVTDSIFPDYGESKSTEPFGWRSYSMFGFLSGVRNYSKVTPISDPKGLPQDSEYLNKPSEYGYYIKDMYYGGHIPEQDRGRKYTDILYDANYHSHSYLTLKELLDFDYSKTFEDRRTTKTEIRSNGGTLINGAHVCVEGSGSTVTYRDYLGESFFECIYQLKMLGAPEDVRIIFWFDN